MGLCGLFINDLLLYTPGNKTDREDREIPRHIGEDFAQRHGMYFLETSAKEAENVERLFMEIAVELMEVCYLYEHVYVYIHCTWTM